MFIYKEIFDFLTSNSCFQIFVNGGSMTNAKVYQGFHDDNSLKSTDVGETHDINFEAPFTLRLAGHIDMLFFRCFVCNLWFLFIVQVNAVLAESLSSLWKCFFLVRIHCSFIS